VVLLSSVSGGGEKVEDGGLEIRNNFVFAEFAPNIHELLGRAVCHFKLGLNPGKKVAVAQPVLDPGKLPPDLHNVLSRAPNLAKMFMKF